MEKYQITAVGDQAVAISFANRIDPHINQRLHQIGRLILQAGFPAVQTVVPAYRTLTVLFDGGRTTADQVSAEIKPVIKQALQVALPPSKTWLIPVLYGGDMGPDLATVADFAHLSSQEAVNAYTSHDYLIYFLGFLPGFAYMASVPDRLALPRLEKPRLKIPAGSVGIAGHQTGFYPVESPGGWRIIGRTPLKLYDPHNPQSFYSAGDSVRFFVIDRDQFAAIQQADRQGTYQLRTVEK